MVMRKPLYNIIKSVRALMRDRSEFGESLYLNKLIKNNFPKYLVDVGAHDGKTISNSYYFVKSGWRAILIEPLPKVFEQLSSRYKKNSNVRCINKACSNCPGNQRLFFGSDGETSPLSTLCTDENDWFKNARSGTSLLAQVDTLTNILIENGFPKDFSLLLIDTEGMDYEVLLGLDFDLFQPRIIVTEDYGWNIQKHNSKYQLLKDRRYILRRSAGCNSIWIKKEFAH